MQYDITYDEANRICRVRVTGAVKRPDDSIQLQAIARQYRQSKGCRLFLFDMREASVIASTMNTYDTALEPSRRGFQRGHYRVALVYSGDLTVHTFMENVLVNRGYTVRVFSDADEALAWLQTKS